MSPPPTKEMSDWLEKLGMSEYAQRFAENGIDFSVLRPTSRIKTSRISVSSLGHRRKLLARDQPSSRTRCAQRLQPAARPPAEVGKILPSVAKSR